VFFFQKNLKKTKKLKNVKNASHSYSKMIGLSIFKYFFLEKFLKIVVFTKKKYQLSFTYTQKFNEKLTKAKKNPIQHVYFYIFTFIFTSFIFFEKTPKITPIFFR
jgi:dolichol kinase